MATCFELLSMIRSGKGDNALSSLYAPDGNQADLGNARDRAIHVIEAFMSCFGTESNRAALFSSPGRTEICGNHTDHQHGCVLCGSVDADMLACAAPNDLDTIRVVSEGYPTVEVSLDSLLPQEEEQNTSSALVRGVAAKLTEMGYQLSGFDVYAVSNVLAGSGLSSSAAYEVLLGNIINTFSCSGGIDAITIAKVGQYAENVYFGKPCGLMDQMGSSIGGTVLIDFEVPSKPLVEKVAYDFTRSGHSLCIVDTGSCHADLTDDYADIPNEMQTVAACFDRQYLREVSEEDFQKAIPALRAKCGDRAILRALHFFADNRRTVDEAQALNQADFGHFLNLVNESGLSSEMLLQNIWPSRAPCEQPMTLALAVGRILLAGKGAIRVHGGGFAGTIQAFVPNDTLESFRCGMEAVFGVGKCHVMRIRSQGGCRVL